MSYATYDSYRDSGVAWLGNVPEHWKITALKFYYDVQLGKMLQPTPSSQNDFEIPYLKAVHIQWDKIQVNDLPFMWISSHEVAKYSVQNGDLLVCEGGEVGRCFILNGISETTIIQNALHRIRASKYSNVKYLDYIIRHTANAQWFSILCNKATIAHLTSEKLINLLIPIPPLSEQTAIADYLDNKLGEIDALISKQETLLAKLAEQRTAIITHAVTKGLNAHAPMKNSGVAWLGDVPEHWEIKHGNQIFKIHNGATPKTSEPNYWGDEITWFTPKDLGDNQNKEISGSLKMITKEGYESCGVSLAPANSIALSKRAPIGHLAITTLPAVVNQGCFLLEVLKANNVNYLYYWLYANKVVLNSFGQGSTFMELPREKFAMLKISIPPLPEQTAIANYLDDQTAKIDRLSDTVRQTIDRLQEYRSTLITQVVTGKVKVV